MRSNARSVSGTMELDVLNPGLGMVTEADQSARPSIERRVLGACPSDERCPMNMADEARSTNDRTRRACGTVRKPMQTCGCGSKVTSWQSSSLLPGTDGSHTSSGDEASWSITSESHVSCGSTRSRGAAYAHGSPRRTCKHKQPVYPNLRCSDHSGRGLTNSGWQISPTSDSLPALFFLRSCSTRGRAESSVTPSAISWTRASAWPRSTPRSIFGARGPASFTIPTAGFNTRLKHTAHGLLPTASEALCLGGEMPYDNAHVESFPRLRP